jgi:hypothetical protein
VLRRFPTTYVVAALNFSKIGRLRASFCLRSMSRLLMGN